MNKKFYITAAIPYVNAKPHIGHALEFVQTNAIARYQRLLGKEVVTLSGGDENALKNVQAAEKANESIDKFIETNTGYFYELTELLDAKFDIWQRGSDQKTHFPSSQKLWELCARNGDIYKKSYKGLYCVGCETFYAKDELDSNGECYEHPGKKLDEVEEENYFFRLSAYQEKIEEIIENDTLLITPVSKKNEVLSFVRSGLSDISISRSNARAKNWGVPVPGDDSQRIYVWFDALNIYQSGVGFGWDEKQYLSCWPADLHVIGKGITRFHAVYWPAFLLSAGLSLPKSIFVHGYYTVDGQKMSKTIGNVYDPVPLLKKYGADSLRYYCLGKTLSFEDGDFSEDKFIEAYNSDLANGLGNLVARVARLCERTDKDFEIPKPVSLSVVVNEKLERFLFSEGLGDIFQRVSNVDKYIEQKQPWKLSGDELYEVLANCVESILQIAFDLQPFLPGTAEKILVQYGSKRIFSEPPLFPRIG